MNLNGVILCAMDAKTFCNLSQKKHWKSVRAFTGEIDELIPLSNDASTRFPNYGIVVENAPESVLKEMSKISLLKLQRISVFHGNVKWMYNQLILNFTDSFWHKVTPATLRKIKEGKTNRAWKVFCSCKVIKRSRWRKVSSRKEP